jgi:uncharacterized protein YxjI
VRARREGVEGEDGVGVIQLDGHLLAFRDIFNIENVGGPNLDSLLYYLVSVGLFDE